MNIGSELKQTIEARTVASALPALSELETGKRAISYLNLRTVSDLWKVNAYINYREPIITSYKNQYYQSAGLTWYFQEGTCIDISRLIYFVAIAMGYKAAQLIFFNAGYTIGHALTVVCDGSCTVIDFNVQAKWPVSMSNISTILPEIGSLVQSLQNFTPTSCYYVKYDTEDPFKIDTFIDMSSDISSLKPVSVPVTVYNEYLTIGQELSALAPYIFIFAGLVFLMTI